MLHAPLGRWGGRLGYALAQNTLAAFEGLRGLACQTVPLAPEHFDATLALLAEEWNGYRTSCPFYLFHARKPDQRGTRQGEQAREAVVRESALCL
ncbi:MAG TPA: hypothetical protein VFV38_34815 [Ktedonobacteraceae bacterium]|nr:hypothetical protein [Ktedonobacteraceae bacterium]